MTKCSRRLLAVCVFLLSLALCGSALAAQKVTITASAAGQTVTARLVETRYRLFLPGTWDLDEVVISVSGSDTVTLGDTALTCGRAWDLSALLGQEKVLRSQKGARLGTLTILQGSQIPSLFITVDADLLKKINKSKNYEAAEGQVVCIEADGTCSYDGALTSFKGRGNSTFAYSKKPYQLKLDKKAALGGMDASKTWILLANYLDLSLLRNQVTLDLCRAVGIPCAIDCRPVDVYINGLYNGLYLMCEKVQVGAGRVDISDLEEATEDVNTAEVNTYPVFDEKTAELQSLRGYEIPNDPDDITGGYILEMEKSYRYRENIDNGFKTSLSLCFTIKEPTCASRAQVNYIASLVNDLHKALYAKDGVSPDTGAYYADYIDLPSFAAKYLIEEFSKNFDAQASSQFFFKDSDSVDGLIYAGPCWDYDLSYGNIRLNNFYNGSLPTRDYVAVTASKTSLYWMLHQHADFMDQVRATYLTLLRPAVAVLLGEAPESEDCAVRSLDSYVSAIEASARMNFTRWPAGSVKGYYTGSGRNFDASVAGLRTFITKRLAYLDTVWAWESTK